MLRQTKFKITLYAVIFSILLVVFGFWIYLARAQIRDYQRLADLKVWQNILSAYYFTNGSYVIPGCEAGKTLSFCLNKKIGRVTINNIDDPVNSGDYRYMVGNLSTDDFQIVFSLEAGIGGLGPGKYILTKEGVKK
jgi:hypothetical protein